MAYGAHSHGHWSKIDDDLGSVSWLVVVGGRLDKVVAVVSVSSKIVVVELSIASIVVVVSLIVVVVVFRVVVDGCSNLDFTVKLNVFSTPSKYALA